MTMITPSYLGETIEYSSLHACRSTLEDPTDLGGAEIVSGGPVCTRAVSRPKDWEGVTGLRRTHCGAGKLLRSAVGGARLE